MMGQEPGGERRGPRLPLLAPFITYELLLRVNNILSPLDNAQRGGWGLQASLGRAVAALTGAPRSACMEEARHQGNAMQAAVVKYVKRLRETHTWNARRSKVGQAGLKKDQETVYLCKFGGTPARPSDDILCAPLSLRLPPPSPPAVTPVPVQEQRRGRLVLLEQGQTVASYAVFEQQRTEAGAREGTRRGMALQLAGQVDARKQLEASLEVEAAHRQKAEAAMRETAARAWTAEQQMQRVARQAEKEKKQLERRAARDLAAQQARLGAHIAELHTQLAQLQKVLEKAQQEQHAAAIARARDEVEEDHQQALDCAKQQRAGAHAEKRAWRQRCETAEQRADQRLKRTRAAEKRVEELLGDVEELKEMLSESAAAEEQRSETGKFTAYPWRVRVAAMAELSRGTPPNCVAQNLVDAAHLFTTDGASFREPSNDLMHRMRQEVTILGETLSSYLVACSRRVVSFGFDESTKLQARSPNPNPSPSPRPNPSPKPKP